MKEKKTVDLLVSRTEDALEYTVIQPSTDGTVGLATRITFKKDTAPDTLHGAILALCAAAGEEPFDVILELAEYLVDDEEACEKAKGFIHRHFKEMHELMEAEAAEKKAKAKDEPKFDESKTITLKELTDFIDKIFG